jgi:hypothetical protein
MYSRNVARVSAGVIDGWHNDALVYELYGLSEEEIAVVEGLDRE